MSRQIFLNQALGRRQFKEVFTTLLMSCFLTQKDELWIVSPWISDFELLDNSINQWNSIVASFESRILNFSEVLIQLIRAGIRIHLVIRKDTINDAFLNILKYQTSNATHLNIYFCQELHSKGVLCQSGFLKGSLNLTYMGVEANDEMVMLTTDRQGIAEARLEFESKYQRGDRS